MTTAYGVSQYDIILLSLPIVDIESLYVIAADRSTRRFLKLYSKRNTSTKKRNPLLTYNAIRRLSIGIIIYLMNKKQRISYSAKASVMEERDAFSRKVLLPPW